MPSRDFKKRLKRRLAYRKFREMYPEKARERSRLYYERQREKLAREREEARRLRLADLKADKPPREKKLAKRPLRNERQQIRRREITSQRRRWQQNNDDNLSAAAGHFLEYWTRKEKKKLCLQISAIRQRAKHIINKPAAGESSRRFVDRQIRGSSPQKVTICSSRGGKFYRDNSCQTTVSYKNKVYDHQQQRLNLLTSPRFRCAVAGCKVGGCVALFPLPCPLRDADRRDEWLRRLGLTESRVCSQSSRVCRRHFHDKYVRRSKRNRNTWTLTSDAVPVPVMTLGGGGGAEAEGQIARSTTNTEEQGDDGAESGFSVPEQSNAEEWCSKFTIKHELEDDYIDVKIGGRRSVATSVQLPSVEDDKSESGDDRRNVSGGFEAAISVKQENEDDDGEAYTTISPPAVVSSSNLVPMIGKQNQRPRYLCSDDRSSIDMMTMKPEEGIEIEVKEEQGAEMRQDSPILIRSGNSGGIH